MKISYKGDYALKALFQLALRYEGQQSGVMSIGEIAKSGDMPTKFLEQILLMLRKGGFVKSKRGIKGGFVLATPPDQITIGKVIRFVEGPLEPISCIEGEHYKGCKDITCCIFRDVWKEVNDAVSVVVDTVNFDELVVRYKEKKLGLKSYHDYSI